MQLQSLVVAAVAAIAGVVAGRATHPESESHAAPPPPSCPVQPAYAAPPSPALAAPEEDHAEPVDDSIDLGEALVHAKELDDEAQRQRNAIVGCVRDAHTGERLAGVTIVMTSPAAATQTVISDEDGNYAAYGLAPGVYTLTYYYGDATVARPEVTLGEYGPTTLDDSIDTTPPPPQPRRFDDYIIVE